MAWTPEESLLGAVTEFQNFSHSIAYYEESIGAGGVDPVTGAPTAGEVTRVYYPVTIIPESPKPTVNTTIGNPATISGFFQYVYNDVVTYRDFNENIVVKSGTSTLGTWEQINMAEVYQIVEFSPDSFRFKTFNYTAQAKNMNGSVRATAQFTINVSDQNWSNGAAALRNAIAIIRARGN
jgi:hypothetical protein